MQSYRNEDVEDSLEEWPAMTAERGYRIVRGEPRASGRLDLGTMGSLVKLGIWECTEGAFECTEGGDELQTVLEGRLSITQLSDGTTREFGPGDSFFTRKGERVIWDIHEKVRKVFYTYDRDGD